MSRSVKKRGALFGAALGVGTTLALVIGLGVFASAGVARSAATPANTSPPTITGTPQEGQTLTGDKGQWSGSPTYSLFWTRCNAGGNACSTISADTNGKYTLTSADVGNTIRYKVDATNADGTTSASSEPTAVITAASKPAPQNTSPPTITGTPQEGQKLTGDRGQWSNRPTDYNFFWTRCDKIGGSCSDISGANNATYRLSSADVGNTLRFKVEAKNAAGSTFASSVPTAVITAATKPPTATGCPAGSGPVKVTDVTPPARLLIDQQQANPSVAHRGTQQIILRYHVSACGGRSVQGALVYATAVPFNQLGIPAEQPTGQDGWAELDFHTLAGFPASPRQQLLAVFVRARKSGENLLGGISTRRLFSVPVRL